MTPADEFHFARWKRLGWARPEWWSLSLCVAAWLLILWRAYPASEGAHASHGHVHHAVSAGASPGGHAAWAADLFWWLVMIAAMMFPLVLGSVRITAARSLWRRRHRAIVGFLAGYLGPWILFGVAASAASAALRTQITSRPGVAAAVGFGAALLWQVTTVKRRAHTACHRTMPLAPTGWRADRDCLRYGWTIGGSCLISCWALMLACVLAGHSIPAMVGAAGVGWAERNTARPNQFLLCAVIAALALAYAAASYM